jgi:hypothetical protein
MNLKKIEPLLGFLVITLIFIGWFLHSDMLKLLGFLILYPWLTINFMNIIRETNNVGKKMLFILLIFINFYLLIDSLIRYI